MHLSNTAAFCERASIAIANSSGAHIKGFLQIYVGAWILACVLQYLLSVSRLLLLPDLWDHVVAQLVKTSESKTNLINFFN